MSTEELVLEKLRALPPDRQQEVLAFVESLGPPRADQSRPPRTSLKGLCADLGDRVPESDIDDARRELWSA